jgi:glycosyltransferase involved in cell wall biosynthesis
MERAPSCNPSRSGCRVMGQRGELVLYVTPEGKIAVRLEHQPWSPAVWRADMTNVTSHDGIRKRRVVEMAAQPTLRNRSSATQCRRTDRDEERLNRPYDACMPGTMLHPSAPRPAVVCLSANTTWYIVNFRLRLIETLLADGWRVVVYSPPDRHVESLTIRGVEHVPLAVDGSGTHPVRELLTVFRMRKALAGIAPTIVLTYTPKINIYLAIVARSLGIPVIANISGLGRAFTRGGWLESVSRLLYGFALRWPATVFFQNDDDRSSFVKAGLVEAPKTKRLPGSGVDIDRFDMPPTVRREAPLRFLLVARLLWAKGVGEFAAAARIVRAVHPGVEFALAGFLDDDRDSAVPRSAIEAWEAEGLLKYLGSFDDMVPVYAAADCVVLPSYYREGVPRSLLEAAAMGKPIVTTDAIGCRDTIVDGVTGLLVAPRDASDLAQKLLQIIEMSPRQRAAMGKAARELAMSRFDERIVLNAYQSAIDACVGHVDRPFRGADIEARNTKRATDPRLELAERSALMECGPQSESVGQNPSKFVESLAPGLSRPSCPPAGPPRPATARCMDQPESSPSPPRSLS